MPTRLLLAALALTCLVSGCASAPPKVTVDDGRVLNADVLKGIKDYGNDLDLIRLAIIRSAELHDPGCPKQWELPFDTLADTPWMNNDARVAWLRTLGVDDKMRVATTTPGSPLALHDAIVEINGYHHVYPLRMQRELRNVRDEGKPFQVKLDTGKVVTITPFQVCRGYTLVASPATPAKEDYQWNQSTHPLEVFNTPLTDDELQWIVLWTQGLSVEGGNKIRTVQVGLGLMWITTATVISLGTGGAAVAEGNAALAKGASMGAAMGQSAAVMASSMAGQKVIDFPARQATLSIVGRTAANEFIRADSWAFDHMIKLGMDPRAGLRLHQKLIAAGAVHNAFVFDEERMKQMMELVATVPPQILEPQTNAPKSAQANAK